MCSCNQDNSIEAIKLRNEIRKERRPFLYVLWSVLLICGAYLVMKFFGAENDFKDKILPVIISMLSGMIGFYLGKKDKISDIPKTLVNPAGPAGNQQPNIKPAPVA